MGISAQVKRFKEPQKRLPGKILAFQRKLMDMHNELEILSKGQLSHGVRRMALERQKRLLDEYGKLSGEVKQLEDGGVLFRYEPTFMETVCANIVRREDICGCPVLFVSGLERVAPQENKQAYRAHYSCPNQELQKPEDIVVYASLYLEDAKISQRGRTDPMLLREAFLRNMDLSQAAKLLPPGVPREFRLALAASELMSPNIYGRLSDLAADQKICDSLLHEVTHLFHSREAGGEFFPKGCGSEEASFIHLSAEVLADASILLYSPTPRIQLGTLLFSIFSPKPRMVASKIMEFFGLALFGNETPPPNEVFAAYFSLGPQDIRELARELMESVSYSLFSKPWEQVAIEPAYERAKEIVMGEEGSGNQP